MLSGCRQAIASMTPPHYHCYEYNIGNETVWDKPASKHIFTGSMESNLIKIVNYGGSQVQYDKNGNIWFCQHRASADATTLARVSTDGTIWQETRTPYRRCGGIRFSNDFSQVVIASNANPAAGNNQGGGFTVYPVNASTGRPIWEQGTEVKTYEKTGYSLMDFAWDYAGNLYMAADATTKGQCIAVYAMPHAADRVVSTPAASKYSFKIDCDPNVTYLVKATCSASEGSIDCTYAGVVGNGVEVPSCTELTLTVTPDAAHKFMGWKDQGTSKILSTDKTFTFSVTCDLTLTATFEYAEYHNITWWNLFKNGEDIGNESTAYPGTNERLWRLYQIEFEKYRNAQSGSPIPWHYDSHTPNTKLQFNVGSFVTNRATLNMNFLTSSTTTKTTPFAWLGKYIENVSGTTSSNTAHWQYISYLFFNRSDKAYNSQSAECTYLVTWTDNTKSFAKDYGMPEYWRPWWTEAVCNLKKTMSYETSMPVTWNQDITCAAGDVAKFGRFNGTAPTSNKETQPSLWYQWNLPPDDEEFKKYHMLAWRANSPTGDTIVHHVYRDNMELHASYVLKNIDENDAPADPANLDASNEDVIKLMQNPNFDPASHAFTVTRKLQKGMYNTICMPLSIDINGLMENHHLKNATVLQFSDVTTKSYNDAGEPVTVLNFTEIPVVDGKKIIEKGKPYLIKVDENVTEEKLLEDMPFTGVARDNLTLEAQNSETINGITFHGTINPTNIPEGSLILVANNRLALTTETGQMLGLRGYFTIDPMQASDIAEQAADGRVYLSFQKPTTTSIPVAPEAEQPKQPKVRKVMYNGQIYILRGDEVYTITGHRVK